MPVKSGYVKDIGRLLLEEYGDRIAPDFEDNKKVVDETTSIESKTIRNQVAGYITSKRRRELESEQDTSP